MQTREPGAARAARVARDGVPGPAERLAARRGVRLTLVPQPGDVGDTGDGDTEGEDAKAEAERKSFTAWLAPKVPDLVIEACKWQIEKGGRIPCEPDEEWRERFQEQFETGIAKHLPKLEMHPVLSFVVCFFFLWLSMRWGAELKKKPLEAKPKKEDSPTILGATTKEPATCAEPTVAMPDTVGNFPQRAEVSMFPDSSCPVDVSADEDGHAGIALKS